MTEINETASEAVEETSEAAEETSAEETETEQGNSQESDNSEAGSTEEEEEEAQDDEDEEPPTRKPRTNADWVALRRQKKLEKQNSAKEEQGEDNDDESEEDDEINDEDAKLIEKVVSKRLAPFEKQQELASLKSEIDQFVADNPDFKPYAAKALKWGQHPSWKDIPTKQLMHAAAGDKLLAIGAKRAKVVAQKIQKTKTGTGTGGNATTQKSVMDMTDEEFQQEIIRVKTKS